jgi:hypothetical protein
MVGSLVVILPTVHEGGSLVLRRAGEEWTFDCSKAVSTTPSAAQAAFIASYYSDLEHEVKTITSGYQVTLVYNLSLKSEDDSGKTNFSPNQENEQELKESLDRLLKKPGRFADGGFIGFDLRHQYPFILDSSKKLSDIQLERDLKGSDALISRACKHLSLDVSVKAFYLDEEEEEDFMRGVLMDRVENVEYVFEGTLFDLLAERHGCQAVGEYTQDGAWEFGFGEKPIVWLRPLGDSNLVSFTYATDNYKQPWSTETAQICLVAWIPPAPKRSLPAVLDSASSVEPDRQHREKRRNMDDGGS